MNHPDRNQGSIPARFSNLAPITDASAAAMPPPSPPFERPLPHDLTGHRGRFSARLVARALKRHWWQAALLWMLGTAGLVYLAYSRIKPTFEAITAIRVDPGDHGLSREAGPSTDFEVFKGTQVQRLINPDIIARALVNHPELLKLPGLAGADDAETRVRDSLNVLLLPRTHMIQVSMSSEAPEEPAAVINAVVEAYLKVAIETSEEETEKRRRLLRDVKVERTQDVDRKRQMIAGLVARLGTIDAGQARDRNSVTIEQYRVLTNQLIQTELGLVDAQATFDQIQGEPIDINLAQVSTDPSRPDAKVVAAFYATPSVSDLLTQQGRARQEKDAKKADEIQKQINVQWSKMKANLTEQVAKQSTVRDNDIKTADRKVTSFKTRLAQLNSRLEKLNVETKAAGSDGLTLEFARQDLSRAEAVLDTVTKSLDQLEFEAKDPVARFRQEYKAKGATAPRFSQRVQAMAGAPLGMFMGVVALVVLFELRSGRVADPDDLPSRVKVNVLGLVPPLPRSLPKPGQSPGRHEARSRRDLDQFIQSLDHLRVAICSGKDAWGRGRRSVLITSACGGEGKTTLAAQLAERCVNAGLLTLLIDGDIRNPSLSRMFDLTEARGLVNVLRGEAMAEEAISTIGGAGGFHFLPAGCPRVDPSRLFQSERLGKLLASARESFDIVLVDSPPVLPVPDALTLGRWVDGAVLAVRYDNSRYPLIEQANRRLANVGVPVIGAVVNGVRGLASSYYGPYASTYGSTIDGEGGSTFEA